MNKAKGLLIALLIKGRGLIGFSGVSAAAMRRLADTLFDWGVTVQKHGRWIRGYDDQDCWCCSECGRDVLPADDLATPYELEMRYYERCGAKMDLDKPEIKALVERQRYIFENNQNSPM